MLVDSFDKSENRSGKREYSEDFPEYDNYYVFEIAVSLRTISNKKRESGVSYEKRADFLERAAKSDL